MDFEQAVVVVPAHNELAKLPEAIKAIVTAGVCAGLPVHVVVVLDACDDESRTLAGGFGSSVHFVEVDARNVGATRAAGFEYAKRLCGVPNGDSWYATTDADSRVDADWLVRQLDSGADMVLGVVRITNWQRISPAAARQYLKAYRAKRRGRHHGHVHGANMGFRAQPYWAVGGFAPMAAHEDVDLVRRFEEAGYRIHRDEGLSVVTSARQVGRAPRGFAKHLKSLSARKRERTA